MWILEFVFGCVGFVLDLDLDLELNLNGPVAFSMFEGVFG